MTDGPHETPEFLDEGKPFLSVDGIQDGELVFEGCRFVSPENHAEYRRKAAPKPGDILMGKAASTGKIARVKTDLEFSIWSPLALLRPSAKVHPAFLEYALKSSPTQAQIEVLCTSNTQKNISMDDIPRLQIPVPPSGQQHAIAALLDRKTAAIDQLIQKKERLIELLRERRQALLEHLLAQARGPLVKLAFYVDLLPGFAFASDGFDHDEGVRLLRGVNVSNGALRWDDTVYWPAGDYDRFSQFQLRRGDVVLGMDRPWISSGMRVAAVSDADCPCLLLQRVARLRARSGLLQEYLLLLLSSAQFKCHFEPILTGVSVPHISPDQILGFRLRMPQPADQRRTCTLASGHEEKANGLRSKLEAQIALLREYRQALISVAVTGGSELDVEVPRNG